MLFVDAVASSCPHEWPRRSVDVHDDRFRVIPVSSYQDSACSGGTTYYCGLWDTRPSAPPNVTCAAALGSVENPPGAERGVTALQTTPFPTGEGLFIPGRREASEYPTTNSHPYFRSASAQYGLPV